MSRPFVIVTFPFTPTLNNLEIKLRICYARFAAAIQPRLPGCQKV